MDKISDLEKITLEEPSLEEEIRKVVFYSDKNEAAEPMDFHLNFTNTFGN